MILDDLHVELLAWCKPKIERAVGHSYICVWLEYAILEKFQIEELDDVKESMVLYNSLTSAIHEALGKKPTVFRYLCNHIKGFENVSGLQKSQLSALARMAWIDKMIETRTIS